MFKILIANLCSADNETKYSLQFNDRCYQKKIKKIKLQFNCSYYEMCFTIDNFLFDMQPSAFETAVDICNKTVIVPELDGKPLDAWLLTE